MEPATRTPDCVFCGIVAGTLPSHTIYTDDHAVAFLDINPASPGHTLVVPRTHATDLFTSTADQAAAVMAAAKHVADLLDTALNPDGLTVVQTNRPAGWQDVFHLHVHLVPRWDGDDLTRPWTPRRAQDSWLAGVADQIAAAGSDTASAATQEQPDPPCHCGEPAWWVKEWRIRCKRCTVRCCDPAKVAAADEASRRAWEAVHGPSTVRL